MGQWHVNLGHAAPKDIGHNRRDAGQQGQGKDAAVLKYVKGGKAGRQNVRSQYGNQCLVTTDAGIAKVVSKGTRQWINVGQGTTPSGKEQSSSHAKKGQQHPENVQKEEAKGIQGRHY